jgi:hypothetical protein
MRESQEPDIVVILDSRPELEVIEDALNDRAYQSNKEGLTFDEWKDSTGVRFRLETQYEPRPPAADAYVELEWQSDAEFRVQNQDVEFVLAAAKRMLNQRRLFKKGFGSQRRKIEAARAIVGTLG